MISWYVVWLLLCLNLILSSYRFQITISSFCSIYGYHLLYRQRCTAIQHVRAKHITTAGNLFVQFKIRTTLGCFQSSLCCMIIKFLCALYYRLFSFHSQTQPRNPTLDVASGLVVCFVLATVSCLLGLVYTCGQGVVISLTCDTVQLGLQ
jgi:hypothetical protein